MQYSLYKIKYNQYFVMYSDRVRRIYFQGRSWVESPYAVCNPHYINKTYRIVIQ